MDLGIRNRVAMVAAASKGLGRAAAVSLAQEGCKVSICGRSAQHLEPARKELETLGVETLAVPCDVSRREDLEGWYQRTVEALGPVDILVTNTGGPKAAIFQELSDADWIAGVDSTLLNVVRLCQLVLPGMRSRRWGRIVHITSLVAKQPTPILTISSTLRSGISGLTKTLSQEVAQDGVTVNALLPGHIMTDRQVHLGELKAKAEGISLDDYFARTAASIPVGRIGKPEEAGDAIAFLCSERASYVTGVSLQVDGGIIQSTF
jgi:3-oxoacyl-[acyl-carrier protein] reductase